MGDMDPDHAAFVAARQQHLLRFARGTRSRPRRSQSSLMA